MYTSWGHAPFHSLYKSKFPKKNRENIAIYGAGSAGIQLMDALRQNPNYSVKLFIDDNPDVDGKNISGIDIFNFNKANEKLISKRHKDHVFSDIIQSWFHPPTIIRYIVRLSY